MIKTEIGYTTPEVITVRGKDLARELLGKCDFVDGLVLCALNRMPSAQEKNMLNAMLVLGLDHGLTPSAITARLTYLGAPESLQGAVAAGLLGAGSRLLGTTERAIKQFAEFAGELDAAAGEETFARAARQLVEARVARGEGFYGYGHPIHKEFDPRVDALREIARANGFFGVHWRLADALGRELKKRTKPLSMNASAAMAACIADMEINPVFGVALMLVARAGGLAAHLIEEQQQPIAGPIWDLVLAQDDRNRLPPRPANTAA